MESNDSGLLALMAAIYNGLINTVLLFLHVSLLCWAEMVWF